MMTSTSFLAATVFLFLFIGQVESEILYAETAPISFEVWAADLKPGFVLNEKIIGDRTCYCKNPGPFSSSSSSFDFKTPGILTSSGIPASSFDYVFLTPGPGNGGNNNTTQVVGRSTGTTTSQEPTTTTLKPTTSTTTTTTISTTVPTTTITTTTPIPTTTSSATSTSTSTTTSTTSTPEPTTTSSTTSTTSTPEPTTTSSTTSTTTTPEPTTSSTTSTTTTPEPTTTSSTTSTTTTPEPTTTSSTTSTTTTPEPTTTSSTTSTTTTPVQTTTSSTSTTTTASTTSTTSTSTSTPSKTTTLKPTTTTTTTTQASGGVCGQCDMEVTIDNNYAGETYEWTSPGWNQGQNYPDNCVCVLKVHYRSSNYASVLWTFDSDSSIKSVNNCAYDRMVVDLRGVSGTWCGSSLPTKSGSDTVMAVNADYTFTFYSVDGDQNQVEKGFKLTIQAVIYGR
ncbi:hypothetical protein SK128_012238 [Halocaridina rubra]|uniref:CUB domain-containing protein n=1 Tax=Halocaridina rubra TaxID=373956 RepID=A0AAN8X9M4_HALRR